MIKLFFFALLMSTFSCVAVEKPNIDWPHLFETATSPETKFIEKAKVAYENNDLEAMGNFLYMHLKKDISCCQEHLQLAAQYGPSQAPFDIGYSLCSWHFEGSLQYVLDLNC